MAKRMKSASLSNNPPEWLSDSSMIIVSYAKLAYTKQRSVDTPTMPVDIYFTGLPFVEEVNGTRKDLNQHE